MKFRRGSYFDSIHGCFYRQTLLYFPIQSRRKSDTTVARFSGVSNLTWDRRVITQADFTPVNLASVGQRPLNSKYFTSFTKVFCRFFSLHFVGSLHLFKGRQFSWRSYIWFTTYRKRTNASCRIPGRIAFQIKTSPYLR